MINDLGTKFSECLMTVPLGFPSILYMVQGGVSEDLGKVDRLETGRDWLKDKVQNRITRVQ